MKCLGRQGLMLGAALAIGFVLTAAPATATHGWGARYWWSGYHGAWPWVPVYVSVGAQYDAPYPGYGALDLDVVPEKAEIYVDGRLVGRADDFDGFPTYLWLDRGTYDVVLYHPGFRTIARQYSMYPGLVIDVEDVMEPGEAVRPEDLPARTTERRDERVRFEEERRRRLEEGAVTEDADGDWRARRRPPAGSAAPPAEAPPPADPGSAVAAERATRLHLKVVPADASVYLDGSFVGTGEELARSAVGLAVAPGEHVVEAVRPGHQGRQLRFSVAEGQTSTFELSLPPATP